MELKKYIRKNLINLPGWRTKKKIIVIESDDWGSIRMPSRETYDLLLGQGVPVDKHTFLKFDCLESESDLNELFNVLRLFKDKNGMPPVITANAVVANPDFSKITDSGLKSYFFEPITKTYQTYPESRNILDLWHSQGIKEKIFWPQFHGREHLNVVKWMNALNADSLQEKIAFENKVLLGLNRKDEKFSKHHYSKSNYMAAFEYYNDDEKKQIETITEEGLKMFEDIFKMKSRSFISSSSINGDHIDKVLYDNGVMFHQGGRYFIPQGDGKLQFRNKFIGSVNSLGQIYWRRNVTFEPSKNSQIDWIDSCLSEIQIAFRYGKPAIINSHRVNYIGTIFPENREKNLKQLKKLFESILKLWPDVEFLNSEDLGNLILQTKK